MSDVTSKDDSQDESRAPVQPVKIVAEMPEDSEMRDNLQEMKENDGHPGSCGI